MNKLIYSFIFFLFFMTCKTSAHVQHYAKLNEVKFDIFRNDQKVGYHNIIFSRNNGVLTVQNEIKFNIKKLGISFYDYFSQGTEVYDKEGSLFEFVSETSDNKKIKYCKIKKQDNKKYLIDGTNFKGILEKDFAISSYWNHEILKKTTQISGISCKIKDQKVSFLRKETIEVNKVKTESLVFDIQGTDLNTQVWFREKDFTIVKQVLNQKGTWRYEVQAIK
jgi:hypothetical protein